MKNIIITFTLIFCTQISYGQFARFTNHGIIEFEKTVNIYALLKPKNNDNSFQQEYYEKYKSTQPQFIKFRSKLIFDQNKSLFTPVLEDNEKVKMGYWLTNAGQINEVYTDFKAKNFSTKKTVFEEDFIVKDSLRKIDWKITSEVREIAGYNCRRANAIIMDSIYVVAFYTDEIIVSGGPESFTGLPGMILGVVFPREHVNWFATKVTDIGVPDKDFIIPNKGKVTTIVALKDKILKAGEYFKESLKYFLL
ncbi:GLPGLI family protein [Pedobacter alpinus]|uniref:GLPGLI family protein n=1 Tax=Pedobacter alpinus TaxID=1590643 RepID=A0ABW5TW66_9SPHI